ncbi:MAG TPA: NYN domain-containing protein [Candidatus Limnocylindria bacterium]|nr:NYN domain-containing protein [Candidatus Limnocylindria bacterium]
MSKNVAVFVDVANMYYAARGQDVDVDYVALLKHATKGRDLIRAYAYTGLDPENENQRKFIEFLAKNGYKPVVKDIRKFGDGRMKANLDIELVVDLFRLADRMDIAVIVSGDGDFAPAIKALQDKGVRCEVISFKPNTSSDLIAVADEFIDIMKIASISRKEGRAQRESMSTPEMPAKEVNPEFGFREASPSVAAAALAAIKGGGSTNGRRTRGGRSQAPAEAPAAPAAESVATEPTAADVEDGARRRRRRRGGRGRGRGRRDEAEVAALPVASGDEEIGWEELEDLSQIDGLEDVDREYGFEEADAATLAELGLPLDAEAVHAEVAEPEPKPARRSRAKKADATEADEKPARRSRAKKADTAEAEAEGEAKAKPARRSRAKKADAEAPDGADAEAKPARRRSSRAKPAEEAETTAASASSGGEGDEPQPQGIWGRFRSARAPRGGGAG